MKDGAVREFEQPHARGPVEPLSEKTYGKFRSNCAYGGWDDTIDALQAFCDKIGSVDNMNGLAEFRG